MSHANARLTVHGRRLLVERVLAGHRPADVAHQLGCSRATAYKWLRRFRAEGPAGLADRPSRPARCPHAHRPPRSSAGSSAAPGPSPRGRLDRRRARHGRLDGRAGARPPRHAAPVELRRAHRRAGAPRAGEPGALRAPAPGRAGAHRRQEAGAHPRGRRLARARARRAAQPAARARATTTSTRPSTTTAGWPTRRSTPTSAGRPARASWSGRPAFFAAHGITRIERVMTDNAFDYRHSAAFAGGPGRARARATS